MVTENIPFHAIPCHSCWQPWPLKAREHLPAGLEHLGSCSFLSLPGQGDRSSISQAEHTRPSWATRQLQLEKRLERSEEYIKLSPSHLGRCRWLFRGRNLGQSCPGSHGPSARPPWGCRAGESHLSLAQGKPGIWLWGVRKRDGRQEMGVGHGRQQGSLMGQHPDRTLLFIQG